MTWKQTFILALFVPSLALAQLGNAPVSPERTDPQAQEAAQRRIEALERELRDMQMQLAQARTPGAMGMVPVTGVAGMSTPERLELERSKRRSMMTGAGLLLGGMLLGRLLPWMLRGRRRRYGDF